LGVIRPTAFGVWFRGGAMKSTVVCIPLVLVCLVSSVQAINVACVGDSITYGACIPDRAYNSYPAQLEQILKQYDASWEVGNFGRNGATMLTRGSCPYVGQATYADALASNPDFVIIMLGTNDSKPYNWVYAEDYVSDYLAMIDTFLALPSAPEMWICNPVPAFSEEFGISPTVIHDEILPLMDQIAALRDTPVLDFYTALDGHGDLFPDGIHPNAEGAGLMAEFIAPYLLGLEGLSCPEVVPEPSSMFLLGSGLLGLARFRSKLGMGRRKGVIRP